MANLVGSLIGSTLPTGLSEHVWSRLTYDGDGESAFGGKAFYAHLYNFNQVADITSCDRRPFEDTVALKRIDFSLSDPPSDILANGQIDF